MSEYKDCPNRYYCDDCWDDHDCGDCGVCVENRRRYDEELQRRFDPPLHQQFDRRPSERD